MKDIISEAGFSFAYTPATPKEGLVDFLNLTERDGKLRVSARQGNVPPNGQYVQFDLPIEALTELRKALSRASQPVDTGVEPAMTHSEALDAIVGAAGVTTLSYQEAIEGYLRLRGMGQ